MKRLLVMLAVISAAITAGWIAVEPWLVTQAERRIAARGDVTTGSVARMPGTARLGLRAGDVEWHGGGLRALFPALDMWVQPGAPTTLMLAAPQQVELHDDRRQMVLAVDQGQAALRPSITNQQVQMARVRFSGMELDGRPFAGAGQGTAVLTDIGDVVGALSAYDVDLAVAPIAGFDTVPGISGQARVWLDRALNADWAASRQAPRPVGLRTEGVTITTNDLTARLVADMGTDADGRASGRLAIYTTDAGAVMDMAIAAGLLPQNVRILARTMMNRIGTMPFASEPESGQMAFPAPADGELRLPVQARDGRLFLGAIEIGAAPRLAAP